MSPGPQGQEVVVLRRLSVTFLVLLIARAPALAQSCPADGAWVQVLGSGGPRPAPERASTSYLLWIDGKARLLVDVGGGALLRYGQSRAQLGDLALIALTHLHPDHVSDLPALMWLSTMARKQPLHIAGPSGNGFAPALTQFLNRLFDRDRGAFPVLDTAIGGAPRAGVGLPDVGASVALVPKEIDVDRQEPTTVFEGQGLTVTAIGIPHGDIPTLAYRVQVGDRLIVFSSDQNGSRPSFKTFAQRADLLVMHLANAAGVETSLHASPATVGRVAADAGAVQLVLGHIGPFDVKAAVSDVTRHYHGRVVVAEDLQCTSVR